MHPDHKILYRELPEWSNGFAWKADVPQKGTEGSNPSLSARKEIPPASESEQEFLFPERAFKNRQDFDKQLRGIKTRPEGGGICLLVPHLPLGINEVNPSLSVHLLFLPARGILIGFGDTYGDQF